MNGSSLLNKDAVLLSISLGIMNYANESTGVRL